MADTVKLDKELINMLIVIAEQLKTTLGFRPTLEQTIGHLAQLEHSHILLSRSVKDVVEDKGTNNGKAA